MDFNVKLESFSEKVKGEKKMVPMLVYCIFPLPEKCRWGSTGESPRRKSCCGERDGVERRQERKGQGSTGDILGRGWAA